MFQSILIRWECADRIWLFFTFFFFTIDVILKHWTKHRGEQCPYIEAKACAARTHFDPNRRPWSLKLPKVCSRWRAVPICQRHHNVQWRQEHCKMEQGIVISYMIVLLDYRLYIVAFFRCKVVCPSFKIFVVNTPSVWTERRLWHKNACCGSGALKRLVRIGASIPKKTRWWPI